MKTVSEVELRPKDDEPEATIRQPSKNKFLESIKDFIKNITVEPLAFLYITPKQLCSLSNENMNLEKACLVNMAYNQTVCTSMVFRDKTGYTKDQEVAVQKVVAQMIPYKSVGTLLSVITLILLGTWSDKTGRRKPMFLVPFIGDMIATVGYLFCIYYFVELGIGYSIFFESVPTQLFGGIHLLLVAMYSYVASVSDEQSRTVRIGAASMSGRVAMTLGIALSGFMYKFVGFYGVYTIALVVYLFGINYAFFGVKECPEKKDKILKTGSRWSEFFNFDSVISSFKVSFKNGPMNRRSKMILILLINIVSYSIMISEDQVLYLYSRRQFGWDEVDFSTYKAAKTIIQVTGSAFILTYFSKHLQWNDAQIGMLAICSKIVGSLGLAFATTGFYFYLGALAEALNGATIISVRSLISKTVAPNERAQANSITAILESLGPVMMGSLYGTIYERTLDYFPGAFYLVSCGVNIPVLLFYYVLYKLM